MQNTNRKAAFDAFEQSPALGAILVKMARAQAGRPIDAPHQYAEAERIANSIRAARNVEDT